jgi:hypothetical protein
MPPRRDDKPRRDRRDRRGRREAPRERRSGAYEKRAAKTLVPITKAMEEGKEFMRSFGDLLQYHKKKKEHDQPDDADSETPQKQPSSANGSAQERQDSKVESQEPE